MPQASVDPKVLQGRRPLRTAATQSVDRRHVRTAASGVWAEKLPLPENRRQPSVDRNSRGRGANGEPAKPGMD